MAVYTIIVDTVANTRKAFPYPGFVEYEETVSGSPKTTFSLASIISAIDSTHKIEVWVDGRKEKETDAWARNTGANTVVLTSAAAVGQWVQIKVFLK